MARRCWRRRAKYSNSEATQRANSARHSSASETQQCCASLHCCVTDGTLVKVGQTNMIINIVLLHYKLTKKLPNLSAVRILSRSCLEQENRTG